MHCEADFDCVGEAVWLIVAVALRLGDALADTHPELVPDTDGVGDTLGESVPEAEKDGDREVSADAEYDTETVGDGESVGDTENVPETVDVTDSLDVGEKVLVTLLLAEDDGTAVCDAIEDTQAETESVNVLVDETHVDTVADGEPVPETERRGDGDDESDTVEHADNVGEIVGEPDSVPDTVTVTDDDLVSHSVVEPVAVGDVESECELHADALVDVLADVDLLRKGDGEKLGDAVELNEVFELRDAAPDAEKLPVTLGLSVELVECDAEGVTDAERTNDRVGDGVRLARDDREFDGDGDGEPESVRLPVAVPQVLSLTVLVTETDDVLHTLALEVPVTENDVDVVGVGDTLGERDGDPVDDGKDVTLTMVVSDTVRVEETEVVPENDCSAERVPQGDTVKDPEPDPDCDRDCVLHGDAEKERDEVPDALNEGDGDADVEPVASPDPLMETVPDVL